MSKLHRRSSIRKEGVAQQKSDAMATMRDAPPRVFLKVTMEWGRILVAMGAHPGEGASAPSQRGVRDADAKVLGGAQF